MAGSPVLLSLVALACILPFSAAQASCIGRCGGAYYRGYDCQCDYDCLTHSECCRDYESACTTSNSCKGRCGESFKRGRECTCDPDCLQYNQCCPDYQRHCGEEPASTTVPAYEEPKKDKQSECPKEKATKKPDFIALSYTERPKKKESEEINQDLSYSHLLPMSTTTPPLEQLALDEQGDGPESTSGYEPLPTSLPNQPLVPDGTPTSPSMARPSTDVPVAEREQEAIPEEIDATSSEKSAQTESSTGTSGTHTYAEDQTDSTSMLAPTMPTTPGGQSLVPEQGVPEQVSLENAFTDGASSTTASQPTASTVSDEPIAYTTTSPLSGTQSLNNVSVTPLSETTTWMESENPGVTSGGEKLPVDHDGNDQPATPAPEDQKVDTEGPISGDPTAAPLPGLGPIRKPSNPRVETDDAKALDTDNPNDVYLADDNNDTNLCSGRPVSGLTALRNGTVAVFRGHYFWMLDSNRVPGVARRITDVWGIPSPIDMVFTRCNCQGKTYFFKGLNYWRFENGEMDPGYPRTISGGFSGLSGTITAALSVPANARRRESVFFFKRGGIVQKYNYLSGTSPTCSRKPIYTVNIRNRHIRQAGPITVSLEKEMNIRIMWKGFPSLVTSAVSIPNPRKPDDYNHYIFSRTKYYNIKIDGDRPTLSPPPTMASQQNTAKNWFRCP